jgi:hypothetical protein
MLYCNAADSSTTPPKSARRVDMNRARSASCSDLVRVGARHDLPVRVDDDQFDGIPRRACAYHLAAQAVNLGECICRGGGSLTMVDSVALSRPYGCTTRNRFAALALITAVAEDGPSIGFRLGHKVLLQVL